MVMDDGKILGLLFERSERGLEELEKKYSKQMTAIAKGICGDVSDAEEVVNDALAAVWTAIPPEYPDPLAAYVYRIVRNLALKRVRARAQAKRSGGVMPMDELADALLSENETEELADSREISQAINEFLSLLDRRSRVIFVSRYWYSYSVAQIAPLVGMTRAAVSMRLTRMRTMLENKLKERGISL